jgi:hypothetical protein
MGNEIIYFVYKCQYCGSAFKIVDQYMGNENLFKVLHKITVSDHTSPGLGGFESQCA